MTIAEQYKEKKKITKEQELERKEKKVKALATKIAEEVFENELLKEEITKTLLEHGGVTVSGLGCLCQGGFCSWQKGFPKYLKRYEEEWKKEGIQIRYSIPGVLFSVEGEYAWGSKELNVDDFKEKGVDSNE